MVIQESIVITLILQIDPQLETNLSTSGLTEFVFVFFC